MHTTLCQLFCQERRKRLDQELQEESKQMVNKFEEHVNKAGFTLGQVCPIYLVIFFLFSFAIDLRAKVRVGPLQRLELFVKTSTGKSLSMRELEVLTERGEIPRKVLEEKQRAYEELKEELDSVLKQIRQGAKKFQVRPGIYCALSYAICQGGVG